MRKEIYLLLMALFVFISNGLWSQNIDVWDFGAEQLDAGTYNNQLTVEIINSWYASSIDVGTSGNNFVTGFTAGALSWIGGSNDRLRTSNTSLTRYDENIGASGYSGRLYINSAAATSRFLSLTLAEDDEVTITAVSQSGIGVINFVYAADPSAQTDQYELSTDVAEYKFVAKQAGTYKIYDHIDKPSYFRIYRKDAEYGSISGSIDLSAASGISASYGIVFTNEAGKEWTANITSGTYSVDLPIGYNYSLSLTDADAYIISSGISYEVTGDDTNNNIAIEQVALNTRSGNVTGLGSTELASLALYFTPTDPTKVYKPEVTLDNATGAYSVKLEPSVEYVITADGANDYEIDNDTITITADETVDVVFAAIPQFSVTITGIDRSTGNALTEAQLAPLGITFTNIYEEGYVYSFESISDIKLRNGTYSIEADGINDLPLVLAPTSNITIDGASISKQLLFDRSVGWVFSEEDEYVDSPTSYKGLLITGATAIRGTSNGDMYLGSGSTIKIPVKEGEKVIITDYYVSNYIIEGTDTINNTSSDTNVKIKGEYMYQGTEDGYIELNVKGTTYLLSIKVVEEVEYAPVIYVGTDKECQTINEALYTVSQMPRPNKERVTIMIDPGNYEEMLVINQENVTLANAAPAVSIGLLNEGVDIEDGAVRVTSYYGHGYSYYSMGDDQKWNSEILRVNKENGYLSHDNVGAGTTNGSYWNATVVVSAKGFIAENIIFENSFNQYISQKESEDIVVELESGGKGTRPTDYGNTGVQYRDYVERGAAIAIVGSADKTILNNCRVVGRQDSFYGANNLRVVIYKGAMMGAVDYIFGGLVAVFYKSDLVMNTSDKSGDAAYLTAAYQESGRGYLMYECNVKSTVPGVETASTMIAKPGYFGRPWKPTTSEVVFYNTTVGTSGYTGYEGKSLIAPEGWTSSLGGESTFMYEYGTIEVSGEDNLASRASWSTVLSSPVLLDDTDITTFNFTKGSDDWNPIPDLIVNDPTGISDAHSETSVQLSVIGNQLIVTNVTSASNISIYTLNGVLVSCTQIESNSTLELEAGMYIAKIASADGTKSVKLLIK